MKQWRRRQVVGRCALIAFWFHPALTGSLTYWAGRASASARTRQKLACIKSIDTVMLITQYGISARAVSEEINAEHMPRLPWHAWVTLFAVRALVVGQPVDPQKIRGKF